MTNDELIDVPTLEWIDEPTVQRLCTEPSGTQGTLPRPREARQGHS